MCPDRARNLADCYFVPGGIQSKAMTTQLLVKDKQFKPECCWLGENAMGATNGNGVAVLDSPRPHNRD